MDLRLLGVMQGIDLLDRIIRLRLIKHYPYGTRVKIEGYGDTIFVAEDCGGKVKGMHVDVFKSTHSETINVQQHRKIYVVK